MKPASMDIAPGESCLTTRALICAAGFDDIGLTFSAEFTRDLARQLQNGLPTPLYEHWIGEQEKRLAAKLNP